MAGSKLLKLQKLVLKLEKRVQHCYDEGFLTADGMDTLEPLIEKLKEETGIEE